VITLDDISADTAVQVWQVRDKMIKQFG